MLGTLGQGKTWASWLEALRVEGLPLPPQPGEGESWEWAQALLTSHVTLDTLCQLSDP